MAADMKSTLTTAISVAMAEVSSDLHDLNYNNFFDLNYYEQGNKPGKLLARAFRERRVAHHIAHIKGREGQETYCIRCNSRSIS